MMMNKNRNCIEFGNNDRASGPKSKRSGGRVDIDGEHIIGDKRLITKLY